MPSDDHGNLKHLWSKLFDNPEVPTASWAALRDDKAWCVERLANQPDDPPVVFRYRCTCCDHDPSSYKLGRVGRLNQLSNVWRHLASLDHFRRHMAQNPVDTETKSCRVQAMLPKLRAILASKEGTKRRGTEKQYFAEEDLQQVQAWLADRDLIDRAYQTTFAYGMQGNFARRRRYQCGTFNGEGLDPVVPPQSPEPAERLVVPGVSTPGLAQTTQVPRQEVSGNVAPPDTIQHPQSVHQYFRPGASVSLARMYRKVQQKSKDFNTQQQPKS